MGGRIDALLFNAPTHSDVGTRTLMEQIMIRQLPYIETSNGAIYKDGTMDALNLPDAILDSAKEYSTHPSDHYLRVILAKWRGEWVTWMVNTNDPCAFQGHYFKTLKNAMTDYHNRGSV